MTSTYTVERTYPVDHWDTDPDAAFRDILRTFRHDAATEATQHGHTIEDVTNVTAYLEDTDFARTPARVRLVATW